MRAFVVAGPSCAGTRTLVELLIAVGATEIPHPGVPENREPLVVLEREMGGEWQSGHHGKDLMALFSALRRRGYVVTPLLVTRDPSALARAQVDAGLAAGRLDAEARIRAAYAFFFTCLTGQDVEWFVVPTETEVAPLLARLGFQTQAAA